uniref:Uncharacterized protein n=1 Tax=Acrobeloides nanus TaxID=290746 RepID=A0A914C9X7_9BILA
MASARFVDELMNLLELRFMPLPVMAIFHCALLRWEFLSPRYDAGYILYERASTHRAGLIYADTLRNRLSADMVDKILVIGYLEKVYLALLPEPDPDNMADETEEE